MMKSGKQTWRPLNGDGGDYGDDDGDGDGDGNYDGDGDGDGNGEGDILTSGRR